MLNKQILNILLIEDDDVDAMTFQRHVKNSMIEANVSRAVDGVEGLAMLRNGRFSSDSRTIIVLDLNMPRMNGDEFLAELRSDPDLHNSIVFVLTTSDALSDLRASYEKNVAGYISKSRVGEKFASFISLLDAYANTIEFPPRSNHES